MSVMQVYLAIFFCSFHHYYISKMNQKKKFLSNHIILLNNMVVFFYIYLVHYTLYTCVLYEILLNLTSQHDKCFFFVQFIQFFRFFFLIDQGVFYYYYSTLQFSLVSFNSLHWPNFVVVVFYIHIIHLCFNVNGFNYYYYY